MLRALLVLIVGAFLAWGGYWFVGSRALERAVGDWITETPAARADALSVRGFPNRFDVTLTNPVYETAALRWSAPFAQVFSLSYKPNHLLAVFPHDQTLRINGMDYAVQSGDMRASVVTRARADLSLDRANMVIDELRARGLDAGEALQAQTVRLASRAVEGDPLAHEIGAEILGLRLPAELRALLDPAHALPAEVERLHLDATVQFDRPLDRSNGADARPQQIDLRALAVDWGEIGLRGVGEVTIDRAGLLSGEVEATVTNWMQLLDGLRGAGLWDPGMDSLITGLLGGLAREDGDETTLTLPISVQSGQVYLGMFPLGYLPAL